MSFSVAQHDPGHHVRGHCISLNLIGLVTVASLVSHDLGSFAEHQYGTAHPSDWVCLILVVN